MKLSIISSVLVLSVLILNGCVEENSDDGGNHAPVANAQIITMEEGDSRSIILTGSDSDGDSLTYRIVSTTIHGRLGGKIPNLIYTPNEGYTGSDSFIFKVSDGKEDSSTERISITISDNPKVNQAPVANAQTVTMNEGCSRAITLTGSDSDGDSLTYSVVDDPTHGKLTGTAPSLTYTPDTEYYGSDSFAFKVNDGRADSAAQRISITVNEETGSVTISGRITYDLVPVNSSGQGLNYTATRQSAAKWLLIEAIDRSNSVVASSTTDLNGNYTLCGIPKSTDVKIRVSAKMVREGTPGWSVKVVDNTNRDALYVLEGVMETSGTGNSNRSLHAPSGWTGSSYGSGRVAAPLAILGDIYHSMQMVLNADEKTVFPPLTVNWSRLNKTVSGDVKNGDIGTSYYSKSNLYILGDEDGDTDEYDDHVIAHEWGHYYEDKFSRADSIGGAHGFGERLDIRVAFGEGFGNAVSGMALNDPLYFDTMNQKQASGWSMNLESGSTDNPGWYSETSIQKILYDLYDSNDDGSDVVNLGFTPLHSLFVGAQKNTKAFTSIFSFITELKGENASISEDIDAIVSSENIAEITDIYGNDREGSPYSDLTPEENVNVCTSNSDGQKNKLSNRRYVKFTIKSSDSYTIKVEQTGASNGDPDFYLYETAPFSLKTRSEGESLGIEQKSVFLNAGDYLLDISEYKNLANACFNVTVK